MSNEEMENIMKTVQSFEEYSREAIKNEAQKQKGGFLGIILDTLHACLLRNLLADKDVRPSDGVIQPSEGTTRAGQILNATCLIPWLILQFRGITRMNPKLMVFIQAINWLKEWGLFNEVSMYNQCWWVQINKNSLGSFVSEW